MEHRMSPRTWPWLGAILGLGVGWVDAGFFAWSGVRMHWGAYDPSWLVYGWFAGSMGILGYLVGDAMASRHTVRLQADTIREQLTSLQATQAALRQSDKLAALGRMVAGVAHEVRNPLAVIRSSAGLLLENPANPTACRFIMEEVDRLDAFVRDLLDFSKPIEVQRTPTDGDAVLARALELAQPHLAAHEVQIEGQMGTVHTDADCLTRLVLGLLVNASEASAGRVEVRLAGRRIDIVDDGPGVPPEATERIFEPFFTTKATGTGLGLPMASKLAEAIDATLELVPDGGLAGACFRLQLPESP